MKEFKGILIPYETFIDNNLTDKEKFVYSMIIFLSKENECTMSNAYIGNLLNICNVQVSRIINSLKKKGYINTEIIYKENSKEIALRKIVPIIKNVNTYKQINVTPIKQNVKDIKYINKINNKNNWRLENQRNYSDFDFRKLYANKY